MGTYLSTPVLEKSVEAGFDMEEEEEEEYESKDNNNNIKKDKKTNVSISWGVVDMQGWRKSMEDAHVARTDVEPPQLNKSLIRTDAVDAATVSEEEGGGSKRRVKRPKAKVFAVFDGHGGPEVARFCKAHLIDVLTTRRRWSGCNKTTNNNSNGGGDDNGETKQGSFDGAASSSSSPSSSSPQTSSSEDDTVDVGEALREAFHTLDGMIDDPLMFEEISRLKNNYVNDGIQTSSSSSSPAAATTATTTTIATVTTPAALALTTTPVTIAPPTSTHNEHSTNNNENNNTMNQKNDNPEESSPAQCSTPDANQDLSDVVIHDDNAMDEDTSSSTNTTITTQESKGEQQQPTLDSSPTTTTTTTPNQISTDAMEEDDHDTNNDDSNELADSDDKNNNNNNDNQTMAEPIEAKMTPMDSLALLNKLLEVAAGAKNDENKTTDMTNNNNNNNPQMMNGTPMEQQQQYPSPIVTTPTRIQNGRQVCNLPDHPVHAGCTSVVVVIVDQIVTVANAGDSRAVMCRANGAIEPLSFDHKPLQEREMKRITEAGGFVNQFGRVNGNLNLSRSIGDLKYKQVAGIPPSGQMITAEPDIIRVPLRPDDEFIILGCDGIWDCLSNEEAVQYVRDRIDLKRPTEIGVELLDEIVSDDPRATQGIGGDNMTCMIVDLRPHTRSYHQKQEQDNNNNNPQEDDEKNAKHVEKKNQ